MKLKFKLSLVALMGLLLSACASESLKAPCDLHAHFCGQKTKINQW